MEREALAQTANAGPPIRFSAFDQGISGQFSSLVSDFVADQTDITFEFIWAERLLDLFKGEADVALRPGPITPRATTRPGTARPRLIARTCLLTGLPC